MSKCICVLRQRLLAWGLGGGLSTTVTFRGACETHLCTACLRHTSQVCLMPLWSCTCAKCCAILALLLNAAHLQGMRNRWKAPSLPQLLLWDMLEDWLSSCPAVVMALEHLPGLSSLMVMLDHLQGRRGQIRG